MSELIPLLKRIGLNEYESKAYSSLISLGLSSASGVSKKAGIPRARVYDVLMGLEKKGFVIVTPSRPIKFRALKPETALSNLESIKRKNFEIHLNELNEIKELLSKKAFSVEKPLGGTEEEVFLVTGRNKIHSLLKEKLNKCSESVIISTNELNAMQKISALKAKLRQLNRKGVKVVINTTSSVKKDLLSSKELKGIEMKFLDSAQRFIVCDKSSVILFLNETAKEEDNERALFIESPYLASYLFKK